MCVITTSIQQWTIGPLYHNRAWQRIKNHLQWTGGSQSLFEDDVINNTDDSKEFTKLLPQPVTKFNEEEEFRSVAISFINTNKNYKN